MKTLEIIEQGRFLGEEFALWLWWRGLTEGGTSGEEGDGTACFVEDLLVFIREQGDVKSLTLAKGNPSESREAFEALARGMRLAKVKMRLLAGDMEWTFTLDTGTLGKSAVKLPPTQAKDPAGRVMDRLFLLEELNGHLDRRLAAFLGMRVDGAEQLRDDLLAWVQEGLAAED